MAVAETRPGARPGETVCEGCIHGPACRVIPCTECGKAWHILGLLEPGPYVCPRCEDAALPCRVTADGWCATHSTGAGPTYCAPVLPAANPCEADDRHGAVEGDTP